MRQLIPIDATWHSRVLDKKIDYLYRGYVIRVAQGGYDVLDPQRTEAHVEQLGEDGWGATVYDAMLVINELVDGCERRKQ